MKEYNQLTATGKKRRLHKVVELALEQYDIEFAEIKYLTEETNHIYRIVDCSGQKYALKVFQEESSTLEDNLAELFLIDTISKNSDIILSEIIYASDGQGIVIIDSIYTPTPKRIALYKWLKGMDIDGHETPDLFYLLGQLTAKLHAATEGITIPECINPKKWDRIFYYRGEEAEYKKPKYQQFLAADYHEVMDLIIPYLNEKLENYYLKPKPQLIHADLNPWNIKIYQKQLSVLDFEEAMIAYPIHDFAIMLFYYRYDPKFNYHEVKKDYFAGYASIRALPTFCEFDLELLMIARRVNFLNYVLLIQEDPTAYIAKHLPHVKAFMKHYI